MSSRSLALALCLATTALTMAQSTESRSGSRSSSAQASRSSSRQWRIASVQSWMPLIEQYCAQYGVDPNLASAVMTIESRGNPNSLSRAGAMGLMQLMPGTAADLGVTNAFDPEQNIRGGVCLLSQNLKRYRGDVRKALAGYNAGPRRADDGSWVNITETRRYVAAITAMLGDSNLGTPLPPAFDPQPVTIVPPPAPTAPRVPQPNYLDFMFEAIHNAVSADRQDSLAENSSLDSAADAMLQAYSNGTLSASDVQSEAARFATTAGYRSGPVRAIIMLTADGKGFGDAWSPLGITDARLVGLSHGVKDKSHVWVVMWAGN